MTERASKEANGRRLGDYELLRQIGRGGMAEVWMGRRAGYGGSAKPCAIKVMLPHIADDPRYRQMFLSEARLCMQLTNTNIVQVFDVGEHDRALYLVMEWVDGIDVATLAMLMRRTGLAFPHGVTGYIVGELLHALNYAHRLTFEGKPLGIVHRDVSPQNVMISSGGEVKLTDFGVARVSREESSSEHAKGKLRYMAREHLAGQACPRSDLYAVGAILHELVAGEKFRDGLDEGMMYGAIFSDEILPMTRGDVPPELETLRRSLLEPEVTRRVSSAADALELLERWPGYRNERSHLQRIYQSFFGKGAPRSGLTRFAQLEGPPPSGPTVRLQAHEREAATNTWRGQTSSSAPAASTARGTTTTGPATGPAIGAAIGPQGTVFDPSGSVRARGTERGAAQEVPPPPAPWGVRSAKTTLATAHEPAGSGPAGSPAGSAGRDAASHGSTRGYSVIADAGDVTAPGLGSDLTFVDTRATSGGRAVTRRVLVAIAGVLAAVIGGGWVAWLIAGSSEANEREPPGQVVASTPDPARAPSSATPGAGAGQRAAAEPADDELLEAGLDAAFAELERERDEPQELDAEPVDVRAAPESPERARDAETPDPSSSQRARERRRDRSASSARARRTRVPRQAARVVPVVFRLDGVRLAYVRVDGGPAWPLEPRRRVELTAGRHRIEYRTGPNQPWKSGGAHLFSLERTYVVRVGARGAKVSSSRGS